MLAITELEFPGYLRWITDRMPEGLSVVATDLDLPRLARHPRMLFPRTSRTGSVWSSGGAQQRYYHDNNLGVLLLGGRRDGTYAYGPGHEFHLARPSRRASLHTAGRLAPEAMLSLIHRERLPLPPCYG